MIPMHHHLSDENMIVDNLVTKVTSYAKSLAGLQVTVHKDVVTVDSGVPSDTFNVIIPLSLDSEDSLIELRRAIHSFQTKSFPVCIWVDKRFMTNRLVNMLQEEGFSETERNTTMKLDVVNGDKSFAASKTELDIRQVTSVEDVRTYSEVFQSVFAGTPEADAIHAYFEKISSESDLRQGNIKMYIGFSEKRAVSTGTIVEADESYGIYDVITREEMRGKGFGSTMFQYLLNHLNMSVKPCVLQASPDGIKIYKRAGFKEVGEIVVFEKNKS